MGSSPCEHGYLPPLCDRCHVPVPGVTVTLAGNTSPGQGGDEPNHEKRNERLRTKNASLHAELTALRQMPASVRELVAHCKADAHFPKALVAAVEAHYAKEVG